MKPTTRIGLVDDHDHLRQALIEVINLNVPNCKITLEASNGQDLIDKLKAPDQKNPDIIIMDINMPIMDGFKAAHWLHSNLPGIKVVALTIDSGSETIYKLIDFGFVGYIHKSTQVSHLSKIIKQVIEKGSYYEGVYYEAYLASLKN